MVECNFTMTFIAIDFVPELATQNGSSCNVINYIEQFKMVLIVM